MQQNKLKVKSGPRPFPPKNFVKGIVPKKQLGQNFIISKGFVQKFVKFCSLKPSDLVIEIGPGLGALTFDLAKRAKKVIGIEIDSRLAFILQKDIKAKGLDNVFVLNENALNFQFSIFNFQSISNFQFSNYKVVGNLPFSSGVAMLMKFLESDNPPKTITIILQKEVGQRIISKTPKMEKLGVFCQMLSKPKILDLVKKGNFYPQPKIDSAIIQFKDIQKDLKKTFKNGVASIEYQLLSKIINSGFGAPRKTLLNNLSQGLNLSKEQTNQWLLENKISPSSRAEALSLNDWLCLAKSFQYFSFILLPTGNRHKF
ncbi:ribosomal RNA small subunit methyltransferase A [Candidatus Gribaldobacteria bacterium]|nr:ribosomal RNA small subunit methyltransferase A [Candidatus Gribaldobacteria bacterium]